MHPLTIGHTQDCVGSLRDEVAGRDRQPPARGELLRAKEEDGEGPAAGI
jgi:hypothetical protein